MGRFVQAEERTQETFLPCRLEDYVTEENPVRVIDVFVEQLDLDGLGFARMQPEATGQVTPGKEISRFLHSLGRFPPFARSSMNALVSVAAPPQTPDLRLLRGQSRLSCGGLNACSLRLDLKMRLSRLPRETVDR